MKDADSIRWTISVPKATGVSVRAYLAEIGTKKGNLSEFVAEAVRWRLFDLNVSECRTWQECGLVVQRD